MGKTKRQACRRLCEHGLPKDTYSSQSSQSLSNVNSSSMTTAAQSMKTARVAKTKATQKITEQVKLMNASDRKILKEIDNYSDIKDVKNILIKLLALNRFNVHSYLRRHYEPNVSYMFRDYVTLQLKVRKLPRHIQHSKAATQLRLRSLRIEIKFKRKVLSQLHRRSKSIFSFIETMTSSTVYSKLQIIKSSIVNDKSKLWRKTLVNKLIKSGFKTEYYDYDKKNDDDIISYNFTPARISGAINLRCITDKFIHRSRHELRNAHDLSAKYRDILKAL
ncbi:unnamed protein product, partial [Didymodactylos carnosus]